MISASFGVRTAYAAQTLGLYTPYPGVTLAPGSSMDYTVTVSNHTQSVQDARFTVKGLASG